MRIDFDNLTFDDFRTLANDESLSRHEKVGFPDSYREGKEEAIFQDITTKLKVLQETGKTILEVGPGCSNLPNMMMKLCEEKGHHLIFVDSEEMLCRLPDMPFVKKIIGRYPDIHELFNEYTGSIDAILMYSVIQYIFVEGNLWAMLDKSLILLRDGGEMLLGDIPNVSMRKRFFASESGIRCHQEFTGKDENPDVQFNRIEMNLIDDSVVFGLLARARASGFHAWVLPQPQILPMSTRREDILICKP